MVDKLPMITGTLEIDLTDVRIHGDIVHSGGTLTFGGGTPQTLALEGSSAQTIQGSPVFGAACTAKVTNPAGVTVTFGNIVIPGTLELAGGDLTMGPGSQLRIASAGTLRLTHGILAIGSNWLQLDSGASVTPGSAASYVNGTVKRTLSPIASPITLRFEIGDGSAYAPVVLTFPSITNGGTVSAFTAPGDHAQIGSSLLDPVHSVNRTWSLSS